MNILIVEDDSDMQKILKLYLQREGYQVNSVSNGRDAIDFLIVNAVDIVLLDWMMPIKNGMETLKEIRQLNIPVKILMLTAKGENADEAAGLTFWCG
ncbi:MAG: response regulator transcription factor [Eisenbergiella sp.]